VLSRVSAEETSFYPMFAQAIAGEAA
jgi:hypothetical protein